MNRINERTEKQGVEEEGCEMTMIIKDKDKAASSV